MEKQKNSQKVAPLNLNLLSSQEIATIESTGQGKIERQSVNGVKNTLEIIRTNRKFESSIVTKRVFPDSSILYDSTIHRFTKKSQADGPFKEFIHHITQSIDQNHEIEAKTEMEKLIQKCLQLNQHAMTQLQQDQGLECLKTLRQAEQIMIGVQKIQSQVGTIVGDQRALSLTLNNFGCYFKKINRPRIALKYLKTALQIEKNDSDVTGAELAVTYLNLCAVYSELNHHHEAINKAIKAVILCKNYVKKWNQENNDVTDLVDQDLDLDKIIKHGQSNPSLKLLFSKNQTSKLVQAAQDITQVSQDQDWISQILQMEMFKDKKNLSESGELKSERPTNFAQAQITSVMGTYSAAFYNLASSLQNLKQFSLAKQAYERGLKICTAYLPSNTGLIKTFKDGLLCIGKQIDKEQQCQIFRSVLQSQAIKQGPRINQPQNLISVSRKLSDEKFIESIPKTPISVSMLAGQNDGQFQTVQGKREMLATLFSNDLDCLSDGPKTVNLVGIAEQKLNSKWIQYMGKRAKQEKLITEVSQSTKFRAHVPFETPQVSGVLPRNLKSQLRRNLNSSSGVLSFEEYLKHLTGERKRQLIAQHGSKTSQSRNQAQITFPGNPQELQKLTGLNLPINVKSFTASRANPSETIEKIVEEIRTDQGGLSPTFYRTNAAYQEGRRTATAKIRTSHQSMRQSLNIAKMRSESKFFCNNKSINLVVLNSADNSQEQFRRSVNFQNAQVKYYWKGAKYIEASKPRTAKENPPIVSVHSGQITLTKDQ